MLAAPSAGAQPSSTAIAVTGTSERFIEADIGDTGVCLKRPAPRASVPTRLRQGDQAAALLVPELEPRALHAVPERQRRDVMEDRVLGVGAREVVVRDPRAQVVDVVEADVAGEELEDLRQLQVRAAVQ